MLYNNTKFAALAGFILLASQCPGATASPVKTISWGADGLPAHAPGPVLLCPGFPTAGIIPIPHFHHEGHSTHSSLSPTSEA
ncbi:hypothetical protein K466DRAFT_666564 [Polyporus arcularius HHB13444]|uniref:Secreted protein n=1 Tax=Polyporus arcularius HHB13444 TaxID=1314778 RepID=A0A5C3P212_9APHY|nr:hypothetical protein K466DRAFT_666564 [Polyporus arcularius HHB13444]